PRSLVTISSRKTILRLLNVHFREGRPPCRPIFLFLTRTEDKSDGTEAGPRAPESAHQQWGGSPHRTEHWLSVAEGNCVVERRGGEQTEANDQSIIKKMMNSIRPDALANTRGSEVKPRTEADPEREAATPRPGLRRAQ